MSQFAVRRQRLKAKRLLPAQRNIYCGSFRKKSKMSRKKGQAVADTRQTAASWRAARMTNASLIQTVTFQMPPREKHLTCAVSVQLGFARSLFFFSLFFFKAAAFSLTCILHLQDVHLSLCFWPENISRAAAAAAEIHGIHGSAACVGSSECALFQRALAVSQHT